jgi:hypothetical protein
MSLPNIKKDLKKYKPRIRKLIRSLRKEKEPIIIIGSQDIRLENAAD